MLQIPEVESSFTQVDLPSGKKIGIKPWRVKEERELLFAVEGQENTDDVRKEIVKMISKGVDNQDVFGTLSDVDYVYLLAQLRKISKGLTIEYNFKCEKCKFELSDDVDLTKDLYTKNYTGGTVVINKDLSVVLKEVSFRDYDSLKQKFEKTTEYNFNFVLKSIDSLIINGEVISQFTNEELSNYIDTLTQKEYKILHSAIEESVATIELKKELLCKRCNTTNHVDFGDLYYFLGF